MKHLLILLIMTSSFALAAQPNGVAKTVKKTFSRETTVAINIKADPAIIWALLTNASDFPRWNSTIVSIGGNIRLGEKIMLKSTLDEKRTFKIKVKEMDIEKRMVWGDGQGNRVFTIINKRGSDGYCTVDMTEKMGGLMFPMYAGMIPPFDESFEHFARDLKNEAEIIQKGQK